MSGELFRNYKRPSLELTIPTMFRDALEPTRLAVELLYVGPSREEKRDVQLRFQQGGDDPGLVVWLTDRESFAAALMSEPGEIVTNAFGDLRMKRIRPGESAGHGLPGPTIPSLHIDFFGGDVRPESATPSFSALVPEQRLYSFVYETVMALPPNATTESQATRFYQASLPKIR